MARYCLDGDDSPNGNSVTTNPKGGLLVYKDQDDPNVTKLMMLMMIIIKMIMITMTMMMLRMLMTLMIMMIMKMMMIMA